MIWTGNDCPCGHPIVTDTFRTWCAVCGARYERDGTPIARGRNVIETIYRTPAPPRPIEHSCATVGPQKRAEGALATLTPALDGPAKEDHP